VKEEGRDRHCEEEGHTDACCSNPPTTQLIGWLCQNSIATFGCAVVPLAGLAGVFAGEQACSHVAAAAVAGEMSLWLTACLVFVHHTQASTPT